MNDEAVKFLNALNSELEEQSSTPREFDDELHDSGEWVFEYRDLGVQQGRTQGGRSHRHGRLVRFFIRFRKFRVGRLVQMSIKKARGVQPTGEEETVYLL